MFDKDEQEISQVIEESLEAVLSGNASLDDVLREHPEMADTLKPELEAVLWLTARKEQVEPRPGFIAASRKRVVERVQQESQNRGTKRALLGFLWPQPRLSFHWMVSVAIVLFILLTGTGGVVSISQAAMPGDQLYPVKRISEEVTFNLTLDEVGKANLRAEFTERRLTEVETLIRHKNYEPFEETLSSYEQEVNKTVLLLQQVKNVQSEQKAVLASQLQSDLSKYAERLDILNLTSPDFVRLSIERARDTSLTGALLAGEVVDDLIEKPPSTVTPTPTPTSTQTATPVPTSIRIFPTQQLGDDPPPSVNEEEEDDGEPKDLSLDEDDPKVTKTPKPTNVNRPIKPVNPQDSRPPKPNNPKPPKEDKPTKTEKDK